MSKYLAVTTCNAELWGRYGRAMANTYLRHWPTDISLRVYAERFDPEINGIQTFDLDAAAPWLAPWKAARSKIERGVLARPDLSKRGTERTYNYRTDAVRFSHKVAALGAAAQADVDVLIWMDSDIVTHSPVTRDWLEELFPESADLAWLDRARKYPECGFMMFRLPKMRTLIGELVLTYQMGTVFGYPETHDSYVIQQLVEAAVAKGEFKVHSLSGEARQFGHPFCSGPLGARLDHLKGDARKRRGRSFQADLGNGRTEPYWR